MPLKLIDEPIKEKPKPKIKFIPAAEIVEEPKEIIGGKTPEYMIPVYKKKKNEMWYNWPKNMIIIGQTGSGKTILIENILRNLESVDHIYLFIPTLDIDGENAITEILDKHKGDYSINSISELDGIISELNVPKKDDKPKRYLMVFDDFGDELRKHAGISNFVKYSRKIPCATIFSLQSYIQLPPDIWKNAQYVAIFTNISAGERDKVLDGINLSIDKHIVIKELEAKKQKYNFIMIDLVNGLLYEKFNKI